LKWRHSIASRISEGRAQPVREGAWVLSLLIGCSTSSKSGSEIEAPIDAREVDGVVGAADEPEPGLADSGAARVTPDAFIAAYVGPGTGSASLCGYRSNQPILQVGAATVPQPITFANGELQSGSATLSVSCTVDPNDGGFNIQLSAEIGGPDGSSVIVAGLVTSAGGSNLQGTFTSAANGSFTDSTCAITFTYNGGAVPVVPPVAAGRIWGHIDCPDATGPISPLADGGRTTCDAYADFLFENCR
jgi:hypothetical protein